MPPKETSEERKEVAERRAEIKNILLPNPQDSVRYQAFLQQPNTGLFRLLPDFDCEKNGSVRIDGKCTDFISGSSFYSFRRKTYTNDTFFDISLRGENLIVGSFLAQVISVRLGDVPLETVSLAAGGMKFLTDFKPETKYDEVKKQFLQIARGIESDGWHYAKNVEASENTTYAMRLVAYRSENKVANRFIKNQPNAAEFKHLIVKFDRRDDIIVAFRIVRRDADGDLTILWKELSRQDAPKIVYEKNEKLSDIR